ncbi:hypothetical protein BD408DRAFT_433157, partial [Parasitella parasitica]
ISSRSTNIQRRSTTTSTITSPTTLTAFLALSALPLAAFTAEVDTNLTNYNYLAEHQGTKYAVVHVHTSEEKAIFRDLIFTQINNQFNDFGRRSSPDFLKLCKYWSRISNGMAIFYKTPELLRNYYNKRQQAKKIVEAERSNRLTIRRMNVLVHNPSRSVVVPENSRVNAQEPQHFSFTRITQPVLQKIPVSSSDVFFLQHLQFLIRQSKRLRVFKTAPLDIDVVKPAVSLVVLVVSPVALAKINVQDVVSFGVLVAPLFVAATVKILE